MHFRVCFFIKSRDSQIEQISGLSFPILQLFCQGQRLAIIFHRLGIIAQVEIDTADVGEALLRSGLVAGLAVDLQGLAGIEQGPGIFPQHQQCRTDVADHLGPGFDVPAAIIEALFVGPEIQCPAVIALKKVDQSDRTIGLPEILIEAKRAFERLQRFRILLHFTVSVADPVLQIGIVRVGGQPLSEKVQGGLRLLQSQPGIYQTLIAVGIAELRHLLNGMLEMQRRGFMFSQGVISDTQAIMSVAAALRIAAQRIQIGDRRIERISGRRGIGQASVGAEEAGLPGNNILAKLHRPGILPFRDCPERCQVLRFHLRRRISRRRMAGAGEQEQQQGSSKEYPHRSRINCHYHLLFTSLFSVDLSNDAGYWMLDTG